MANELLATEQDLIACYRIFLDREPDAAGFSQFSMLVNGGIPLRKLAALLRDSTEGLAVKSHKEASALREVRLKGFRMNVLPGWNAISDEILATHDYEPHISRHIREVVKRDTTFVDIGANIGFYSMLAASAGARVEAFEPHSRNVWMLQRNAALNGFDVKIHAVVLAESERLYLYSPIGGNGQISEPGDALPADEQQLINARTLDAELAGVKPAVIKIDVEGAEGLVMRGAQASLDAKPVVFSEFSASALNSGPVSAQEYLDQFGTRGYRFLLCRRDGVLAPTGADALIRQSLASDRGYVDFAAFP